ncbi:helicase sen1-like isoform X2 [Selaginella moellendorffii]|uniref:helicase sen1-like isoform X2 n=1 Tax=Selaginella moellendorffii TaxID=88036 RepID=UPI000D1C7B99|nr:helicase sen1-like isoform X2 [Selaginella moellendorffii]|eukprot:XP_024515989.1 helicase sen1-like isoform X2 [Selaginella moellendorffii]
MLTHVLFFYSFESTVCVTWQAAAALYMQVHQKVHRTWKSKGFCSMKIAALLFGLIAQSQPAETELQRVPGSFASLEEYVQVFEPLLFEECRAQLFNVWEELRDSGKEVHTSAMIKAVDKRDRGWYDVTLLPLDARTRFNFKEGDVAVLSTPPQDAQRKNGSEDAKEEGEISIHIAGIARRYMPLDVRDAHGAVMFINFSELNGDTGGGYPNHLLDDLRQGGVWSFTVLGGLATTQREYVALHALYRLHPQMLKAILQPRPELFPRYDQEQAVMLSCFTPGFTEYLRNNFNAPQLSAIQWAAMHTAAGTAAATRSQEIWPFSLVQGPPGTGKTHTVWGMLNAIHLVQYQRYYTALLKKIAPGAVVSDASAGDDEQGGWIDEVLQKMDKSLLRQLPKLCPKPRMLVCAPSNAATDELLSRVLDKGFMDGEMRVYRPDVARVGTDPQSKAAQAVSVEKRTESLIGKGRDEILEWLQRMRLREYALSQHIAVLQKDLNASRVQGAVGVEPEVLTARDQARDMKLQQLASLLEERDKVLVDMSRFVIVDNLHKPGGGYGLEDAKSKLEASFANEAEIVFTTVSSSGRKLFTNLARGFDIVVIDEAAQASELGVLPPLILGAARCVLVGDPQQLPATVISRVADTMQYSRSLFERFQQAGCPTLMLTVQYRMHPQIRDFPSRHFYQGRLQDSDSVKGLPDEIYHHDPLLQPYLFFDVSHGKESHISGSVSFQNVVEAKFAAKLYDHLQGVLKAAGRQQATVGVISPYKLQLRCIQREFESLSGDAKGVYINTVDAFQGQERDVIIMSCVRASNHGVGFVADIRRMNVALTRARRSLWVIGNAGTLEQSEDWAKLIEDAKSRNCFITSAAAVEKGLISDGVLSQVLREPTLPSSLSRLDGHNRAGSDLRGTRDNNKPGRRGRYEAEAERKTADNYLRQHNSFRRG